MISPPLQQTAHVAELRQLVTLKIILRKNPTLSSHLADLSILILYDLAASRRQERASRRRLARRAKPQTNQSCERRRRDEGPRQTTFQPGAAQRSGPPPPLLLLAFRIGHSRWRQTGAWAPGVSPPLWPALNHKHAEPRRAGARVSRASASGRDSY